MHFFEQFLNLHFFWCKFQNCSKFGQLKLHDLQIVSFDYLHITLPQPPPTPTTVHTTLRNPTPPPMPPKPKAKAKQWGKVDKKHLFNLVRTGDVDITDTSYVTIEDIRKAYFDHCNVMNFCRNFRNFCSLSQPRDRMQWCKVTQNR